MTMMLESQKEKRKMSSYSRAQVIAASREIRKSETRPLWLVESETVKGKFYKVVYVDGELMCDCKAYEYGMTDPCKHIISIALIETKVHK